MGDEEYTWNGPEEHRTPHRLERREFLKLVGGGIVILFTVGDWAEFLGQERRGYPSDFNAYLRIGEDGRVSVYSGKIEMGQGVVTSLAQMAAEELGVPLDLVDMVMGDTQLCPWDMGTFGSMSTRFFGPALRGAAAEAREVLLELAAEQLKTPKEQLSVENAAVYVTANKASRVTFGQLAKGQKIERHLSGKVATRNVSEFVVMGKPTRRTDAHAKVTGKAQYAGDVRLPEMLYARVLRPPTHGATLKSVDTSGAKNIPGALVINQEGLVAVLHADPEEAAKALAAVKAEFAPAPVTVDTETIFDHFLKSAAPGQDREAKGNLAEGEKLAASLFESKFLDGYVAHAPIETHTALAHVESGKATLWISTQTPFPAQQQVAQALGFPPENVRVITPFVGGGFGGKSSGLQATEAAKLAKITGRPVQVAWTRAEEFFYDTFRPAAVVQIKSGLDGAGKICLWDYRVYCAGARGTDQFYDVPHNLIRVHGEWSRDSARVHPFGTGPWRAPGANTNSFARESQIDIMAAKAKMDPLEFRLNNTSDKRMRRVLQAAAERFGWKKAAAPSGRGVGVACGIDAGTYVALMAEAQVDKSSGNVKVKRIVAAQDMGVVVNPDGAAMQMEGCATMGLGYALAETIRFKGGEILDHNFDTYQLPRFSWLPQIETVLVKNDELTPQGGGEPAIVCMGAVVANAIHDAVGARLYRMPMTPERVKQGLKKA
jgi:nicotinate dehydrogenase subunit B